MGFEVLAFREWRQKVVIEQNGHEVGFVADQGVVDLGAKPPAPTPGFCMIPHEQGFLPKLCSLLVLIKNSMNQRFGHAQTKGQLGHGRPGVLNHHEVVGDFGSIGHGHGWRGNREAG